MTWHRRWMWCVYHICVYNLYLHTIYMQDHCNHVYLYLDVCTSTHSSAKVHVLHLWLLSRSTCKRYFCILMYLWFFPTSLPKRQVAPLSRDWTFDGFKLLQRVLRFLYASYVNHPKIGGTCLPYVYRIIGTLTTLPLGLTPSTFLKPWCRLLMIVASIFFLAAKLLIYTLTCIPYITYITIKLLWLSFSPKTWRWIHTYTSTLKIFAAQVWKNKPGARWSGIKSLEFEQ